MPRPNSDSKVVLVVFDGLRPDLVNDKLMPLLSAFARESIWYRNAQSVFPSMTRVASSSIATGVPPASHGVLGNEFYFPAFSNKMMFNSGSLLDLRRAESIIGSDLVLAPTFCDHIAANGRSVAVVHTGSPGAAYCLNPRAHKNGQWTFSIHGEHATLTPDAVREVVGAFGPLPTAAVPQMAHCGYATDVFVDHVLANLRPDVSVIWYSEPDTTLHYHGLGAPETKSILRRLDQWFGAIREELAKSYSNEDVVVIVASDHGHVTIEAEVDLFGLLSQEGHRAPSRRSPSLENCAIAATGWNVGEITAIDNDTNRINAIARWLQEQDFIEALFSADRNGVEGQVPGTLSYKLLGVENARQPDLMYTLRGTSGPDRYGYSGTTSIVTGCGVPIGGGMHGGLNKYELRSTLIVGGSAVDADKDSDEHRGITDIAPTILDILGIPIPSNMVGQLLHRKNHAEGAGQTQRFVAGIKGYEQWIEIAINNRSQYLLGAGRTF